MTDVAAQNQVGQSDTPEATAPGEPASGITWGRIRESGIGFRNVSARQWISGVLHDKATGTASAKAHSGLSLTCGRALAATGRARRDLAQP
jgi:hypothetical protein